MTQRDLRPADADMSGSPVRAPASLVAVTRIVTAGFGAAAIAWGAYMLPLFWRQAPIERTATHVIAGDPFKIESLTALLPNVDTIERAEVCRPSAVRAAAIIRLRLAEDTISAGQRRKIDDALRSLRQSIRHSLGCSPADPFLWLVLFWVENSIDGFSPDHLGYLRMSYRLGPNEAWIALKRDRFALALYDQLPPDLAKMAIREFASLLNSGFFRDTAAIFIGVKPRVRNRLLPELKDVAEIHREEFYRRLYSEGYDVDVPGIKRSEPRPWH
jgi:hypothetical protein